MRKKINTWFIPHILNPHNIEKVVDPKVPGVYVLGDMGPDQKFKVKHIKSADDVKMALRQQLGKYPIFMYKPFKHFDKSEGMVQQTLELKLA